MPSPSRTEVADAVQGVFADDPALADALRAATAPPAERKGFLDWFREQWNDLNDALEALRVDSPPLYWLFLAGLLLVLGLLLLHIGRTVSRAVRDYRAPTAEAGTVELAERRRRHSEWLDAARAAASRGELRSAVRMLVLSLLALLDERHVLRYASSWTTREILARLEDRTGEATATFGRGVESASYGSREPLPGDYARLESAMLEIAHAVTSAREGTS